MKDWTGNKKSVFSTIGAAGHSKENREEHDFYATDPKAIDRLLTKVILPKHVWEPACGMGHLSNRLRALGYDVYASDIVDRGANDTTGDFFEITPPTEFGNDFCILTNPPFRYAVDFVNRAFNLLPEGCLLCLFLKTTWLESRHRWEKIFKEQRPQMVLQLIDRILCAKNGEFERSRKELGAGAQAYAWYIWEKGKYDSTMIDWI